jgi:DNA-binding protein HU-beta
MRRRFGRDPISPNKIAGFFALFGCNFISGVVIFASQKSPVLLARVWGGGSRGIFLSGDRRALQSEAPCFTPHPSLENLWRDTEIKPRKRTIELMANVKKMSKTQLATELAEATETNKKTAAAFIESLSNIAYRETKKVGEFVIPGIGKLVKKQTKARLGRNPATGAEIQIQAKTVIRFRVAKAAKDAVIGAKK